MTREAATRGRSRRVRAALAVAWLAWPAALSACGDAAAPAPLEANEHVVLAVEGAGGANGGDRSLVGHWAWRTTLPLSWSRTMGVKSGDGVTRNYFQVEVAPARGLGGAGKLSARIQICGMDLPETESFMGRHQFLVDHTLFDADMAPWMETTVERAPQEGVNIWASPWVGFPVGLRLKEGLNAAEVAWPESPADLRALGELQRVPSHASAGLRAEPNVESPFVAPKPSVSAPKPIAEMYFAIRNVLRFQITDVGERRGAGRVWVRPRGSNRPDVMLDSTVLHFVAEDGAQPGASPERTVQIINKVQPALRAEVGDLRMVRLSGRQSCKVVRSQPFQDLP